MSLRVLVLVSGGGSNLQALIDAQMGGKLGGAEIVGVVGDRLGIYALERARLAGIPVQVMQAERSLAKAQRRIELSNRILAQAQKLDVGLIVLAGFLQILQGPLLSAYERRIINMHPALLPKFGGDGMYGQHVHRAVLAAGESESGCTVHFADSGTDTGEIILQRRVPVEPGDDPESLAARILVQEHIAIVEAVVKLAERAN